MKNYKKNLKTLKLAKKNIPGINMLLSKNPNYILPDHWPTYYSRAKYNNVWDLDGNKYLDMFFGVGTNTLGYANSDIDNEVIQCIKNSNMSSLNCMEEVELSERLIKMHPWSGGVKFARTGGEANAISIRIARAFTGKDKIAVCGYHGWHDWYLANNISNQKNLDKHLIKGINANGVPRKLKDTVFTFNYNDFDSLIKITKNNDLAAIKMEVERNFRPNNDFLHKIRKLCDQKKILLIFDECTSGFRETYGGLHLKYKINPDICTLGKTISNGYALTAVLGKKKVMNIANELFISSTFWTERIGYVAALKTLETMKKIKSWKIISNKGKIIKSIWEEVSNKYSVDISISGIDAIPSFIFNYKNHNLLKTFLTKEMLKKNILATNTIYISTSHDEKSILKYKKELSLIFLHLENIIYTKNYSKLNINKIARSTFSRLN